MDQEIKPIIFADKKEFSKNLRVWSEHDIYDAQSRELREIMYSHPADNGNWIYFPWSGRLVHMVDNEAYTALRTNRNRNLITLEEQKKLGDACVGIVGLSVGSNVATTLSYGGIANTMKLAEFDTLETTNLNRIRARIDQIGIKKIDIVAQQIYEINPYANLSLFSKGITEDILQSFVTSNPKPRVIFEIIDSFEMKIHLRVLARIHRIPVVMITNLGDRALIDVERYDLDPSTKFFNGRAGTVPDDILASPDVSSEDKHRYAVALAGVEHIPQRALDSVKEIGHTLVGRPQLGSTVTLSAALCSHVARKIILGEDLPSCSWLVDLENIFHDDRTKIS